MTTAQGSHGSFDTSVFMMQGRVFMWIKGLDFPQI